MKSDTHQLEESGILCRAAGAADLRVVAVVVVVEDLQQVHEGGRGVGQRIGSHLLAGQTHPIVSTDLFRAAQTGDE